MPLSMGVTDRRTLCGWYLVLVTQKKSVMSQLPLKDKSPIAKSHYRDVFRKVAYRIVPFLCLCYLFAYLDRVNVGLAKLQMAIDLGLTDTAYGMGAGLFFVGYVVFEIPSNLLLYRLGARVWIGRIMVTWGVLAVVTLFVRTPTQFYVARFFLGVAEAGFMPGVLLYLSYWFPSAVRGRIVGFFLMGLPLAGLIGNPLSGWVMASLSGVRGYSGWQWLFFLEGIPSIALGFASFVMLPRDAHSARWLSEEEKRAVAEALAAEPLFVEDEGAVAALMNGDVWKLAFVNLTLAVIFYLVSFWLPTIIRESGITGMVENGLLTTIPSIVAIVLMLIIVSSSDRRQERRLHLIVALLAAGASLSLATRFIHDTFVALSLFTIANAFVFSGFPVFWAIPAGLLRGRGAAAGIGLINSVANLGGFLATFFIGWLKELTHGVTSGLLAFSGLALLAAIVVYRLPRSSSSAEAVGEVGERRAA